MLTAALTPLTTTLSEELSTVPLTVMGLLLNKVKVAGEVIVTTGVAMTAAVTLVVAEPTLPARSVACTEIEFVPGVKATLQVKEEPVTVAAIPLQVTVAMPERASLAVPIKVAVGVVSTAPDAGDVIETVGGVLSMLMLAVAVALFPARSVALPVMT